MKKAFRNFAPKGFLRLFEKLPCKLLYTGQLNMLYHARIQNGGFEPLTLCP